MASRTSDFEATQQQVAGHLTYDKPSTSANTFALQSRIQTEMAVVQSWENTMQHYDAIVLGTGGVGSAAAFHLARRGIRTLGLDRFRPAHDRGSSHGETRIIRQAYFEHPDYVPLLLSAYRRWAELEAVTGEKVFHQVGLLQMGPATGEVVPGVQRAARLHKLSVESLSASEIRRRFPGFEFPENLGGVFESQAGYLRVEKAVLAHHTAAKAAGAELRSDVEVVDWQVTGQGVEVHSKQGTFAADRLIITAGAWAGHLLADLQLRLRVLRKYVYWFGSAESCYQEVSGCPTFLLELPNGVFYGFPQRDELGVKLAEHTGGEPVDDLLEDTRPEVAESACSDLNRVQAFREQCLPGVGTQLRKQSACYYTMSPDENFIVDIHPEHPQVVFAAGLSGHGFKFTPILGDILADLAMDGRTDHPIGFLSLARFKK